jgi:hypothetical protein
LGHEAYSCDIQEYSGGYPEWHLQIDVFEAIKLKKNRGYSMGQVSTSNNNQKAKLLRSKTPAGLAKAMA